MSPRLLGEIMSEITMKDDSNYVCQKFRDDLKEIMSHPKEEIINHMVHITDKDIFQIREQLFIELAESSKSVNIICELDKNNPISNLRKRYKSIPCYEDIYVVSMSIIEDTPHKDLVKFLINSPQVKSVGTLPQLHTTDTAMIALMQEMKDQLNSIRKENKDLKDKIDI